MHCAWSLTAVLAILLSGCIGGEVLESRSSKVPVGVDFSGRWQLRANSADTVARIDNAERRAAGGDESIGPTPRPGRRRSRGVGSLVHVFLETGENLKITQTAHGIFISFDRAVVEEYRFGEHREIRVGPVLADRVSGWEGRNYVVETLDDHGSRLTETYRLSDDGAVLVRHIVIRRGKVRELDVEQRFDRL